MNPKLRNISIVFCSHIIFYVERIIFFTLPLILLVSQTASASELKISINIAKTQETRGILAFDLIGNGTPANFVRISILNEQENFISTELSGAMSVGIPVDLSMSTDNNFFNEEKVKFSLTEIPISFQIDFSYYAPNNQDFPDAFSLFILNAESGIPMFNTTDPSGANASFLFNMSGNPADNFIIYDSNDGNVEIKTQAIGFISEPPTLFLIIAGLAILLTKQSLEFTYYPTNFLGTVFKLARNIFLLILPALPLRASADEIIKEKVLLKKGGIVLNRITGTYDSIITISNESNKTIAAPIAIKISNISGPNVEVYNAYKKDEGGNVFLFPDLINGLLNPGEKKTVLIKFKNKNNLKFSYSADVTGQAIENEKTTQVFVRVHDFSVDSKLTFGPVIKEAGVKILINGIQRAVTDSQGTARFQAFPGETEVTAQRSITEAGSLITNLKADVLNEIDVVLDSGKEIFADAKLLIDQVQDGILTEQLTSFNFRLITPSGNLVKLKNLDSVTLHLGTVNSGNIAGIFKISEDGQIKTSEIGQIREFLYEKIGKVELEVVGTDEKNNAYFETLPFEVPRPIRKLQKSSSFDALEIYRTQIPPIRIGTNLGFENHEKILASDTKLPKKTYDDVPIDRSLVSMASSDEIFDYLKEKEIGFLPDFFELEKFYFFKPMSCPDIIRTTLERKINVWLMGCNIIEYWENIPQRRKASALIPKGTKRITLAYNVRAFNVSNNPQSQLSDYGNHDLFYFKTDFAEWGEDTYWGVNLKVNGSDLFDITRNFYSHLAQPPIFLQEGNDIHTGIIKKTFEIDYLTKDQDALLELNVFYRRNSIYTYGGSVAWPPVVVAGVKIEPELEITSISVAKDSWPSKNDGTYFSIPSQGEVNSFHKKFNISISKPEKSEVESGKIELVSVEENSLVLDAQSGTEDVLMIGENKLQMTSTFKDTPSRISSVPPPSEPIQYRIKINGITNDGNNTGDEKSVSNMSSLWHAPLTTPRFGSRDQGGDDWCTKETYQWINSYRSLLTPINDISGEHGKDLKHKTHAKGTDIDMYSFYTFPGANPNSGMSNYKALVSNILNIPKKHSNLPALQTIGLAAVKHVRDWITATRSGIDALAILPNVSQLGYIKDGPDAEGISEEDWGSILLKTGKIKVVGTTFDLGVGSWENAKYFPWPGHHDHVHLTLRFDQ